MTLEYRIGDVFDRLREIPDGSIDLIVTSPPFLALRSYLPADHPDKHKEIGSEPTPAEFLDTLYALTAEWGRVLAPHGSICVELGDTYSGSGGAGGDYTNEDGLRAGQATFKQQRSSGWPLPKSLTGIPTLYPWGLAYGRNLLTGQPHDAGQWRIRNLIVWARPNPPVGALGDKFRPATSYITVACKGQRRYFDLDAVRTEPTGVNYGRQEGWNNVDPKAGSNRRTAGTFQPYAHPAGAPPLDWHADDHPEDGDWLWKLSTQPYKGSHYATFPLTLPKRLIEAMCPLRVCTVCGKPSERIVGEATYDRTDSDRVPARLNLIDGERVAPMVNQHGAANGANTSVIRNAPTLGWTDCGCPDIVAQPDANTPLPYAWVSPTGYVWVFDENGSRQTYPTPVTPTSYNGSQDGPGSSSHQAVCSSGSDGGTPGPSSRWRSLDVSTRWRTGIVLDPFAGSGTTLEAAQAVGRHALGIDLDERNAELARERVGMFLNVEEGAA